MYVDIIVFRLLKHSDALDIKTPTLLGEHNTFTVVGVRPPVSPLVTALLVSVPTEPPKDWVPPGIDEKLQYTESPS